MTSAETAAINALTAQAAALTETCLALNAGVSKQIADAVAVSENGALVPLMSMAAHLITMQAGLVPRL